MATRLELLEAKIHIDSNIHINVNANAHINLDANLDIGISVNVDVGQDVAFWSRINAAMRKVTNWKILLQMKPCKSQHVEERKFASLQVMLLCRRELIFYKIAIFEFDVKASKIIKTTKDFEGEYQ